MVNTRALVPIERGLLEMLHVRDECHQSNGCDRVTHARLMQDRPLHDLPKFMYQAVGLVIKRAYLADIYSVVESNGAVEAVTAAYDEAVKLAQGELETDIASWPQEFDSGPRAAMRVEQCLVKATTAAYMSSGRVWPKASASSFHAMPDNMSRAEALSFMLVTQLEELKKRTELATFNAMRLQLERNMRGRHEIRSRSPPRRLAKPHRAWGGARTARDQHQDPKEHSCVGRRAPD